MNFQISVSFWIKSGDENVYTAQFLFYFYALAHQGGSIFKSRPCSLVRRIRILFSTGTGSLNIKYKKILAGREFSTL